MNKKIIVLVPIILGILVFFTVPLDGSSDIDALITKAEKPKVDTSEIDAPSAAAEKPKVDTNDQVKISCAQTFDKVIVPTLTGELKPSQISKQHWEKFLAAQCATNHAQWINNSFYADQPINWEILLKEEENFEAIQKLAQERK